MARPRTYNEDDILTKARNVFWSKGFAATSISDLEVATGLKRTSLYAAFKDKQGLYIKCLHSYKSMSKRALDQFLKSSDHPLQDIRLLFENMVILGFKDPDKKGCFFNNACSERISACNETKAIIESNRKDLLNIFERQLTLARDLGQVHREANIKASANYLFTLQSGLMINLKNGASLEELLQAIDIGLKNLTPSMIS